MSISFGLGVADYASLNSASWGGGYAKFRVWSGADGEGQSERETERKREVQVITSKA